MNERLAYAVFLFWIGAGLLDFWLHRRSDLPHTSGLAENRFHLAQLLVIGAATLIWWSLSPTWGAWSCAAALVALHAVLGYLDTRTAYGRRAIVPLEQHVHSVLDAAPVLFLGWYALQVQRAGHAGGLEWAPRPLPVLLMVMLPAGAVMLVALLERRAAWQAARR